MKLVNHLYHFIILVQTYTGGNFAIVEPWEILKDFTTAEPLIKPYFDIRSAHSSITSGQKKMDGENSDNISVLVKTMSCLGELGETTHPTMDSNAADGKLIFVLNITSITII